MSDRVSDMLMLVITLIILVAFIGGGMTAFSPITKFAYHTQDELINQVDDLENAKYYEYDNKVISGREAKNIITEYAAKDAAILVNTISMNNNVDYYGTLNSDLTSGEGYGTRLEGFSTVNSKGETVNEPYVLNFGAVLCASATGNILSDGNPQSAVILKGSPAILNETSSIASYGTSRGGYNQKVQFEEDGNYFKTTFTFATNSEGLTARNDKTHDLNAVGSTLYMADSAQFKTYLIKDLSTQILGFAFIQVSSSGEV